MKTFTEAGASCKDIHSSNMLNERVKLSQISMPDDNIRHEIFVPKKQASIFYILASFVKFHRICLSGFAVVSFRASYYIFSLLITYTL